jgi:hypothetical protein
VILVHNIKTAINFDCPRGRKEVQKIKWTPPNQTELDGESEKNNSLAPSEFLILT